MFEESEVNNGKIYGKLQEILEINFWLYLW